LKNHLGELSDHVVNSCVRKIPTERGGTELVSSLDRGEKPVLVDRKGGDKRRKEWDVGLGRRGKRVKKHNGRFDLGRKRKKREG